MLRETERGGEGGGSGRGREGGRRDDRNVLVREGGREGPLGEERREREERRE